MSEYGGSFTEVPMADRVAVMKALEKERPTAFRLVMELIYEAYYRDPSVLKIVELQTGFRTRLAVDGFATPKYDSEVMTLLAEMGEKPSLVREAGK